MIELHPLSNVARTQLVAQGLDPDEVIDIIHRALVEDLGDRGDVTSAATIDAGHRSHARYVARVAGRVAGVCVVRAVLEMVVGAERMSFEVDVSDGSPVKTGGTIMSVTAPTRELLTAERTSLNLLGHLCGIATLTAQWVDAVSGTGAVIRDTRKTTPGLRALEKFAVRCGGGQNHRLGLSDAALIKDNHVVGAGSVTAAVNRVRRFDPEIVVEVEVDTLDQLHEALRAGADLILLDNMDVATTHAAVAVAAAHRRDLGRDVLLESSGGLNLAVAAAVAATGVSFLSIGALTHSAPTLDIGLDVDVAPT